MKIHSCEWNFIGSSTYTWTHPEDGAQTGTLMLGVPGDEGDVSAAWVDSWHQPDVVALTGRGEESSASVGYEYAPGWRWKIEIRVGVDSVSMAMVNVVAETETAQGVSYDAMRATWA